MVLSTRMMCRRIAFYSGQKGSKESAPFSSTSLLYGSQISQSWKNGGYVPAFLWTEDDMNYAEKTTVLLKYNCMLRFFTIKSVKFLTRQVLWRLISLRIFAKNIQQFGGKKDEIIYVQKAGTCRHKPPVPAMCFKFRLHTICHISGDKLGYVRISECLLVSYLVCKQQSP